MVYIAIGGDHARGWESVVESSIGVNFVFEFFRPLFGYLGQYTSYQEYVEMPDPLCQGVVW